MKEVIPEEVAWRGERAAAPRDLSELPEALLEAGQGRHCAGTTRRILEPIVVDEFHTGAHRQPFHPDQMAYGKGYAANNVARGRYPGILCRAMEASCSSRVQVYAELNLALSIELTFAEGFFFNFIDPVVDKSAADCSERRRTENDTTDVGHHTVGRRQLVKPTPMSDYVCSEVNPASASDNVCQEFCMCPQKLDEEDRKPKSKAPTCRDNFSETLQDPLDSVKLLWRVDGVLQQAQKSAMSAEEILQRLVAVCSQNKAVPVQLASGTSTDDALREVGKEGGTCNWTLIDADGLGLHGAGHGDISEMTTFLTDNKVLFGVLRLSINFNSKHLKKAATTHVFSTFGSNNTCSRSKTVCHVFIHWVGPDVSAVRRGLFNAKCLKVIAMAKKHCTLALQRRASR